MEISWMTFCLAFPIFPVVGIIGIILVIDLIFN
jgi:hypothetical protein